MSSEEFHAVTGAFGFTGKYIARRLLAEGKSVRTLTNSPQRNNPFGNRVDVVPLQFNAPEKLAASLQGVSVLYNTYWTRFSRAGATHVDAARNTEVLFAAAKAAGVARIVHLSITHPDEMSPIGYFREKARLERVLIESGISYAILRPASIFGDEDILINNLAWTLRRLPIFGIFGDGSYRIQPIHVDDLAQLAVTQGGSRVNSVMDAIGPETFTYRELVETLGRIIGKRRPILPVPVFLGYAVASLLGLFLRDTLVTRDEIAALMSNKLAVSSTPTGTTRLTEWATARASILGRRYASELARRRNRLASYDTC